MCGSHTATAVAEDEEVRIEEVCNEEEKDEEVAAEEDIACLDQSKIEGEILQSYGELHYEHFLSGAAVQQHKKACKRVTSAQTKAIKRALRGKLIPGVDIDSIINPIMDAAEKYRNKGTEQTAQEARLTNSRGEQVIARRRSLGVDEDGNAIHMYDVL